MTKCECLPRCPFFNDKMANMPRMAETYKKRYCLGDNSQCARYMVFKAWGRERVPPDLFPNQRERARQLLGN
ncbi:hypothetical protein [Deferrisoma palaeochoriense]